MPPRADLEYNVNTGLEIKWPSNEYEDIMLRQHNAAITEAINKDAMTWESESPAKAALEQMEHEFAKMITGAKPFTSGCNHEWFMYGRTAATKHCKKCGIVKENIVDND
jgi:hypothetical protein